MDIIRLLPDMVANQIAAGEVIQRPASAVKELMENAIDAGATEITVVLKDAGKTLIQISDNGCGMSESDARLCFARHATSKIREAGDLFSIRTMGFRGEALASIASIAQVELKTKRVEDETGTSVHIEGSDIKLQEPCQCNNGTSFMVKNLFFNVPARRNFLKADATELSYIIEEFQRVALVNSKLAFELFHNGKQLFRLLPGTPKQRIIGIFGNNYGEKLVPAETESNIVNISGYIGKPEFAKRTRGEQYFFANKRFIKHPYLHHAVMNAYQELIADNTHPSYFLFLDVDPKTIDINIHPTKTEVKFEDEKSIYAILRAAVKQAIGKFSLTPSLDFEMEKGLDFTELKSNEAIKVPQIKVDNSFNPFEKSEKAIDRAFSARPAVNKGLDQWEKLYPQKEDLPPMEIPESLFPTQRIESSLDEVQGIKEAAKYYQLQSRYILTQIKSGLIVIHQQNAHERVLYERYLRNMSEGSRSVQQLMFPQTISFNPADAEVFASLLGDLYHSGFDIEDFGKGSFIVNGVPGDFEDHSVQQVLEHLLESYKQNIHDIEGNRQKRVAAAFARQMAIRAGKSLSMEEMRSLVDLLFACSTPESTADGRKTFYITSYEEIAQKFN
jgi:DNA mismatch repair protein MutL